MDQPLGQVINQLLGLTEDRPRKRPPYYITFGQVVIHRYRSKKGVREVKVPVYRAHLLDHSRYTGAHIREINRKKVKAALKAARRRRA